MINNNDKLINVLLGILTEIGFSVILSVIMFLVVIIGAMLSR